MASTWLTLTPHLILALGGLLVFCTGAFAPRRPSRLLWWLALLAALAAGGAAAWLRPGAGALSGMLDLGPYGRFFSVLLAAVTALTLLLLRQYAQRRDFAGDELYGTVLYAALGMILTAGAVHWLVFFLGLELLSISLYVLIASSRLGTSLEAGVKYFIMGAVASAVLIFGIALLYGATGTLALGPSLSGAARQGLAPASLAALAFILLGVGFKISLVPFHLWTPDVYQGAPAPITAFLATGSKVAVFAALLRLALAASPSLSQNLMPLLWVLAALTMVVGNLSALRQTRLKRLLAFSSAAQMGYLLMALLAAGQGGRQAVMFFLAVYALMDLGAFGTVSSISHPAGEDLEERQRLRGLGYAYPWRGAALAVCLFSLAGLPPTGGFLGKFLLFQAALRGGYPVLAFIGILSVVVAAFYYLRVVVSMYMRPASELPPVPAADLGQRLALILTTALILILGLAPGPLLGLIAGALPG